MSTTASESGDHQYHQEMMFDRLIKSQEDMFERLETMFSKVLASQQEMCEILRSNSTAVKNNDDKVRTETFGAMALYKAAESGDWQKCRDFLKKHSEDEMITYDEWREALGLAVLHCQLVSVKEILKLMPPEALRYKKRESENTALHHAARDGFTEAVKMLVIKNPRLTQIRNHQGKVPLQLAIESTADVGQWETVKYLFSVTRHVKPSPFLGPNGARMLCGAIAANLYDSAMSIVRRYPELVTMRYQGEDICGLEAMAQKRLAFRSGFKLTWWNQDIYSSIDVDRDSQKNFTQGITNIEGDEENALKSNQIIEPNASKSIKFSLITSVKWILSMLLSVFTPVFCNKQDLCKRKLMHKQAHALVKEMFAQLHKTMPAMEVRLYFEKDPKIIKTAMKHGTIEVVEECIRRFPLLVWGDFGGQLSLLQMAVVERNEKAFNLIIKTSYEENLDIINKKDGKGNTLLHHVVHIAPSYQLNSITGAVLQMQRELQWFKGVQSIIAEEYKVLKRNNSGETAENIFTTEHKELIQKGEKYMKDTSGSCMVVAALIATVAFAAAFTVPGGNISDSSSSKNGTPVFLESTSFVVFATADALALFSSITSVLMFLAIYTSRFAEENFLVSLPRKMIIGLATLFVSMATILVTFGASLSIVLDDRVPWAPIPIALFSCIPPISFGFLQLPLFVEMVRGTFLSYPFKEQIKNFNKKKVD
ncbi:hypothetical protein MKW98_013366 [Papaver atlanticum]|uniref:PGG domain-containing protein n=1 Tax=Papaver atlanticum TaxID=357466 RepID=A0AAD4SU60_9MAGN|nr:hypothetical protein MKW98_013366 [Papaver atlanticum]